MSGKISDIDYISGSDQDQEGGIIIHLKNGKSIEASCVEFDAPNDTFETS